MAPHTPIPRLLLAEDDAVARAFLAAAAQATPARVDVAASVGEALALARDIAHDLYLLDAHLPDGNGAALLHALRAQGRAAPAIAHTAARERATLDALLAAGFTEVLLKPMAPPLLQHAIRRALAAPAPVAVPTPASPRTGGKWPVWDEDAALAAVLGQRSHARQLRALFLDDLPARSAAVLAAADAGDVAALQAGLHLLQGACAFVAAARLGAAVAAFSRAPNLPDARTGFAGAVADTLAAPGWSDSD